MSANKGPGTDAMQAGEFFHPETGDKMRIDPAALKADPGLADKIRKLSKPPNPIDKGLQGAAAGAGLFGLRAIPGATSALEATGVKPENATWLERNLPWSNAILPKVMAADAALNLPVLNLGERMGIGRIRPELSNDPNHLRMGVEGSKSVDPNIAKAILENKTNQPSPDFGSKTGPQRPAGNVNAVGSGASEGVGTLLGKDRMAGGPTNRNVLEVTHRPQVKDVVKHVGGSGGSYETTIDDPKYPNGKTESMNKGQAQALKRDGFFAENKDLGSDAKGMFRVGKHQFRPTNMKTRLLGRAGLYGAVPLAEYGANSLMDEQKQREELRSLMQSIAKPVAGK